MQFTLDGGSVLTGLFITCIITVCGILWRTVRAVDKLIFVIGTLSPPDGLIGKLFVVEMEMHQMRDWMIRNGYERRGTLESSKMP